jgi:pseudouridylate synthase
MISAVEGVGAVPGITAVVCGEPTVGLEKVELDRFLAGRDVRKVSARDLGVAVAQRADGATTVAAALVIASLAGIRVFATGGIGGVHRRLNPPNPHALNPPAPAHALTDESADLVELANTPMIVVCAGAKSILDLPATWERLETLGVPVIGVGTGEFPGFYTASTGIKLSVSVENAAQVARIAGAHFALGRKQSVLVVQPPPADVALAAEEVEEAVKAALERAGREGISGGEVTPYLLGEVSRKTGGKSLDTNLALLEANAKLAAEIARAGKKDR